MGVNVSKVMLIGKVASDPVMDYTTTGVAFCKFEVAVERPTEEKKVDYHHVVAWGRKAGDDGLAGICAEYAYKEQAIYVEGRLEYWKKEGGGSGADIRAINVQFLERKAKE